MLNLDIKTD